MKMSPRWLLTGVCLILLFVGPAPVASQAATVFRLVRTALCSVSSATFVFRQCAPEENTLCRIIAFKLSLFCQAYPCTNYGAPPQRRCADLPLDCPIVNIRPLGLCQPLKVCCSSGATITAGNVLSSILGNARSTLKKSRRRFNFRKPSFPKLSRFGSYKKSRNLVSSHQVLVSNDGVSHRNQTEFVIPSTPQEYSKDWLENEDDPAMVEQAIKQQYDKFILELTAINKQETELGKEPVPIPSFEEFHSAALGENHV